MNDITSRKIKTGGDPRTLADYAALRDELSKLAHPARPDVNWHYVEKRCLSLFELNGVELQTAAWYTLARTQLAGLFGLNEGLTILEALISHQWGPLWPQPVHTRMDILSSLSQRLQQRMRSLPLNYSDLSQLYRAEQLLTGLGEVLQRLELKHLSQLDTLRTLMHNSAVRLESSDGITSTGSSIQPAMVLPATVMNAATAATGDLTGSPAEDTPESAVKWVYVAQPEPQPNVEVLSTMPAAVKKWKPFVAGMCTMLVISTVAVWSWQFLHRTDSLPDELVDALPPEQLNGWYQGMATLQKLSDRLNGLDEQKGKYMTVSELKTVVFSVRESFNQSIPAEEQLRVLSENPAGVPLPAAARSQLEMHLKQLAARYAEIKQNASQ